MKFPPGYSVRFSDDGKLLACLGRNVVLIDVAARQRIWTKHPLPHPSHVAFSPDGALLAVKSTSGRIVVLDTCSGEVACDCMNQKEGEGSEVHFSPDGGQLINGSWQGWLTVREASDGTVHFQQSFAGEMIRRVTHDQARLSWLFEHSPTVRSGQNFPPKAYLVLQSWPFKPGGERHMSFNFHIMNATLSLDGQSLCLIEQPTFRLHVASVSDGVIRASGEIFDHGGSGNEIAWSSDSQHIVLVRAGKFVFYRAADLTVAGEVSSQYPSSISFRPGGDEVVLGTWTTSTITLLNTVWQRGVMLN